MSARGSMYAYLIQEGKLPVITQCCQQSYRSMFISSSVALCLYICLLTLFIFVFMFAAVYVSVCLLLLVDFDLRKCVHDLPCTRCYSVI